MLPSLVSFTQAVIAYPDRTVISSFDLDIFKGRHLAVVGQSGSGKTSLLNAIAGNLQLKQGVITRDLAHPEADARQFIAFVGSRHHFRNLSNTSHLYYQQRYNSSDADDALTVTEYLNNIPQPAAPSDHWDLAKVIAILKLAPLADKQIIKLSNGETKRLMIAAALLKNPVLLLLDNPMTGLDTKTRIEFNMILGEVAQTGITIVMTTSPNEIPEIFTQVAALKDGEIQNVSRLKYKAGEEDLSDLNFDLKGLLDRYPAPAYQEMVTMRNINITYGDKVVLSQINWRIKQGERWALMGHNGAGKSTLLSLINGDNPQAYANDITLFDRKRGSGESIWDIKKKTGFISPELYQYFPADSSCLQAIESGYYDTMGLFRSSDKAKAERALQWMKVLEIEQYARQFLKNIPASAQRLCLLARAMIKAPALLILDEPCQGMDEHQLKHFKSLIDTICAQTNITLIYVTHYAEHIPHSVSDTLLLENGNIANV